MPINAPITQISGRGVYNFTDARGDMNQVLGVDKSSDKWLVSVKSPLGTKVFEIPLVRAADEREATTQVEYLMKNNAKLDVALAEMDTLVGAVADVGRKVDGLEKKDAGTDHAAMVREHEAKFAEHRKIGKANSTSMHTTAMRDHNMGINFHTRALNAEGTKEYAAWAKHAAEASIAAEKSSKRAFEQEPNGPVKVTPQAKW